jgi:hypothetical protein
VVDLTWFLSALAQSTAAIVGLMGAFVFTKVVNNQAAFQQAEREADQLGFRAKELRSECGLRSFTWYNERVRDRALRDFDAWIKKNPMPEDRTELVEQFSFSPFDDPADILEAIEERIESYQPVPPGVRDFSGIVTDWDHHRWLSDKIEEEGKEIWRLYTRVQAHIDRIALFLRRTEQNPYSAPLVPKTIVALGVLFLLGVVYPLGLLPWDPNGSLTIRLRVVLFDNLLSLRGLLLSVVTVVFGGLLWTFYQINRRLVFPNETTALLEAATRSDWYSEYFGRLQTHEGPTQRG